MPFLPGIPAPGSSGGSPSLLIPAAVASVSPSRWELSSSAPCPSRERRALLGAVCLAQFLGFYSPFVTQSSLSSRSPPALMGSLLSSAKPAEKSKKKKKKSKRSEKEEAGGIQGKPRRKNEEQFVGLVGSLPPFPSSGCLSLLSAAQGGGSWEVPHFLS